jgi:hypothetical protein
VQVAGPKLGPFIASCNQAFADNGVNTTGFSYSVSQGSVVVNTTGPAPQIADAKSVVDRGLFFVSIDGQLVQAKRLEATAGGSRKNDRSYVPVVIVLGIVFLLSVLVLIIAMVVAHRRRRSGSMSPNGAKAQKADEEAAVLKAVSPLKEPKQLQQPLPQANGAPWPYIATQNGYEFYGQADVLAHPDQYDFYVMDSASPYMEDVPFNNLALLPPNARPIRRVASPDGDYAIYEHVVRDNSLYYSTTA